MRNYQVCFHKVTGKRGGIAPAGAPWRAADWRDFDIITAAMTEQQYLDVLAERADPTRDGKVVYRKAVAWGEVKVRDAFLAEAAARQQQGETEAAQKMAEAANHVSAAIDAAKIRLNVVEVLP